MEIKISYYENHYNNARVNLRVGKDLLDLRAPIKDPKDQNKINQYIISEFTKLFGTEIKTAKGVHYFKKNVPNYENIKTVVQKILNHAVAAEHETHNLKVQAKPLNQKLQKEVLTPSKKMRKKVKKPAKKVKKLNKKKQAQVKDNAVRTQDVALEAMAGKLAGIPHTGLNKKEIFKLLEFTKKFDESHPLNGRAVRVIKENKNLPRTLVRTEKGQWLAQLKGRNGAQILGKGGNKVVKTALDLSTGKILASATVKGTAEKIARACEEAKFGKKYLNSPGIHGIVSSVEYSSKKHPSEKKVCLFSELADRGDLAKNMQYLNPSEKRRVAEGILTGLEKLHEDNVHHRDLKPQNILITTDPKGNLKAGISDFGAAYVEGDNKGKIERFEYTPGYASAELEKGAHGVHNYDKRADIYSAGLILGEMYLKDIPFKPNLGLLVKSCISPDPANRPTANQLKDNYRQLIRYGLV